MKRMQQFLLVSILASLPAVSMASFVDDIEDTENNIETYVGLAFKYNWIRPTNPWSRVLVDHHPGFDIFFGGYINECWSVDVGYDWTTHEPKSTDFRSGEGLLGVTNTGGVLSFVKGEARIKAAHADLNYFLPSTKKPLSIILSVGLAVAKPGLSLKWGPGSLAAANANFYVEGRATTYPRLGVGLQGMFSELIGFRGMLRWENSCRLRGRFGAADLPDFKKIFKNGHSASIGLIFKM
ncbi:MAG: hypothetical protein RLZ35_1023 [Pseudomonadota bacterium]|jgi:hypothetical protein